MFCVRAGAGAGSTSWLVGAALSFKPFSTHYTFHGGFSALGAGSGALCVHLASIVGSAAWYYGAALSFILHIILIVAVLLTMVSIVALFLFLVVMMLLILIGTVVLLYKYTLYFSWSSFCRWYNLWCLFCLS